ncbi:hypothetical protein WOLCODRAFT_19576 [Wolfiporia cocos MD-104 SS10]|uniref:CoA-dependent acyltransferase n=1 Tax=Wolfiporia cocos (strain MD-104) TaxID=742152 RepID=A0A2H3IYG3_WOLCO|nr:hypothetical protein WOLCODRAFT_19576 [Wolfiporia cocos MD-104 SS10]
MATKVSNPYVFSTSDRGKTYTRNMHGLESLCACFAICSEADIFFYQGLCSVQFPSCLTSEELRPAVRTAWIQLRHLAPHIALRTSRLPDKTWQFHYDVPVGLTPVEAWAESTIVEHFNEKSLIDRHTELTTRIWPASSGKHVLELHFGPQKIREGVWVFGVRGPHCGCDFRIAMALLNQFLLYLWVALENSHSQRSSIFLGEEISRLSPAPIIINGELDSADASQSAFGEAVETSNVIPFLPPVIKFSSVDGITIPRKVTLDEAKSRAFRELCSNHSRAVTQAVDSLYALSHVETMLRNAQKRGEETFRTVINLYETSDVWLIPLTFKDQVRLDAIIITIRVLTAKRDQRSDLRDHTSLLSDNSTPLLAIDGYSLALDMSFIRGALNFDAKKSACARKCSNEAFWDGVVADYIRARERIDVSPADRTTATSHNFVSQLVRRKCKKLYRPSIRML